MYLVIEHYNYDENMSNTFKPLGTFCTQEEAQKVAFNHARRDMIKYGEDSISTEINQFKDGFNILNQYSPGDGDGYWSYLVVYLPEPEVNSGLIRNIDYTLVTPQDIVEYERTSNNDDE
jgi:hypothetical protein